MDLPHLIESLADPDGYPYPVSCVRVRQTHISAVFLAGPYVYKVKKPVKLGFLDFSTLEMRFHFCQEEVRLNRRLAPQVYLGVVPVVQTRTGVQFEGEGKIVEWAVKMQRLPDEGTFQERLRHGRVSVELVEALAQRIASFHREAETSERSAAFGRFEVVAQIIQDIFTQASPQVEATVSREVFRKMKTLTEESLVRLRSIIEARCKRGMTRECHGDLHLDHVYFFPEREPPGDLVIIDCIEFNEQFRFIDPVADMAFPTMDFAFYGRRDLARAFADAYFCASDDEEGRALLPLYTAYRATVRATMEGLLLAEKEVPDAERVAALRKARRHWLLALTELEAPSAKPCLILVAGLPGTGKSKLALALADSAGFHIVRSDLIRKELAGLSGQEPTPSQFCGDLYTPEWNERTYAECLKRVERLLFEGKRVLVDATFREEHKRQAFLNIAAEWGVPSGIVVCQAESETVKERLANRRGDASDADFAVYLRLADNWEEIGNLVGKVAHIISTEGRPEQVLTRALEALQLLGLWD